MNRSVGLVVPAYRPDEPRLESYLAAVRTAIDPDVIRVELDDPKGDIADRLQSAGYEVNAVPYRRGKGAAITSGFEAIETDVYVLADADGSTPATSLAAVIEPVVESRADLSVGSRRHAASDVRSHQTVARRFLGDGFAWLARRILDAELSDYQCGAKAISAPAWEQVRQHLFEPGFAWDVELVAMAGAFDLRIVEIPITWEDQPGSTVSPLRTTVELARVLFVARHRAKQIRENRLHEMIASRREDQTALVDQECR
ncbi:MAG: glycosyltransferase [Halovenus sp.]